MNSCIIAQTYSGDDLVCAGRPCVNRNCTKKLPSSPQERLLQLLERKFQLPVVTYGSVIHRIADNISQQDYIFVTAASSNHFEESRALLKNLRERVFSQLQKYLLVFINLGLNNQEKEEVRLVTWRKLVWSLLLGDTGLLLHVQQLPAVTVLLWLPLILVKHL